MSASTILIIVIAAALFVFLVWIVVVFNQFIRLKNSANEALSNMDVYFKKRHDLIPNLVNTVKGYAKHEAQVFQNVTEARTEAISAKAGEKKAKAEAKVSATISSLFAVAENYPDLKANTNFLDLQNQLSKMETEIAGTRMTYNEKATNFNNLRETFPSSIVAFLMGVRKRTLFKADWGDRKNIKVEF